MKVAKFLFLTGYVAMLTTITCTQQDEDKEKTATIYGRVVEPDGKPIEGLYVYIRSHDTKLVYSERLKMDIGVYVYADETYTDKQGRYKFEKVTITQSRRYEIIISNPKDPEDPFGREKQILTPDKYALEGNGCYISQDITLEEKEYKKEVNFNLTKPATITGKVTFEDGTPVKGVELGTTSTYGTHTETDENGNYIIKGVKPDENKRVSIVYAFPRGTAIVNVSEEQKNELIFGQYNFVTLYNIPVSEGETTIKDIIVPKSVDASKIPIRYQVFVNGQLCTIDAIETSSEIYKLGFVATEALYITLKTIQKEYFYVYSPPVHGKAEIWDIPLGKYTLEINYEGSKVSAQTEIEIKENKTLELEIYVTMKDKKLEKIEIKLKE